MPYTSQGTNEILTKKILPNFEKGDIKMLLAHLLMKQLKIGDNSQSITAERANTRA